MAGRPLRQRQGRIRLPVVGDIPWRSFYFGTVLVPPLFVVAVWLFFSRVDWPHLAATRALFVSAVSLVLSVAFSMFLLNVVGRAYQRLRTALRTVRRQNLQLRALHRAGLVLNEDRDLESVLQRIVGLSRHVLDVASARLETVADGHASVGRPGPERSADPTVLRVPVLFHAQLLAVLHLSRPGLPFADEEAKTAERFATSAGAAIANARLLEQVRRLAGAAERERIARDLHDGTVQALFGLSFEMQAALLDPGRTAEDLEAALRTAIERMGTVLRDLRDYVSESHHDEADRSDLESALRKALEPLSAAHRDQLEWRWPAVGPLYVPSGAAREVAAVVVRVVDNAFRLGGASHVTIAADVRAGSIVLEMRDDGLAHGGEAPGAAYGFDELLGRIHDVGGELRLDMSDGQGTSVVARLPWLAA